MERPEQIRKPLNRAAWWLLFLAATYGMSLWFQTFKTFTLKPSLENGLVWLGVMLALGLVLMVLVYDSYMQEKANGRVQRPMPLLDWLASKQFLMTQDLQKGDRA